VLFNGDYTPYYQRSLLIGGGRDTGYLGGGLPPIQLLCQGFKFCYGIYLFMVRSAPFIKVVPLELLILKLLIQLSGYEF